MPAQIRVPEIDESLESLRLVDHHCHGVYAEDLNRSAFELALTESGVVDPAGTHFDSQLGYAVLRWCPPALGLDAHAAPEDYLERRGSFGAPHANQLFLGSAGVSRYLVDTGYPSGRVLDLPAMASAATAPCSEIVRLESVAEDVARTGAGAGSFVEAFRSELATRLAAGAVGTKSIAAYRYGFDFDPERPEPSEVGRAAGRWRGEIEATGQVRLHDPTLVSHLLWEGIDAGVPLQLHVGVGDPDLEMLRCNPLHLTRFMRLTAAAGTPIMLLHCYPYHREAGYLAHVFPHVFFDIGLAVNLLGAQSRQVVGESLELAPFAKQLYSSDGWGVPELHFVGSRLWRDAMSDVLSARVRHGDWSLRQALKVASMIGAANAERLYGFA